jgi:hypothetical protein
VYDLYIVYVCYKQTNNQSLVPRIECRCAAVKSIAVQLFIIEIQTLKKNKNLNLKLIKNMSDASDNETFNVDDYKVPYESEEHWELRKVSVFLLLFIKTFISSRYNLFTGIYGSSYRQVW